MNDCQNQWAEAVTKNMNPHFFPRPVAKAIVEGDAFIYPDLLPTYYDQNCDKRLPFVSSEDALLIYGLDQLKDVDLNWRDKAKIVAQMILIPRGPSVVYHRIRNLRKKNNGQSQMVKVTKKCKSQYCGFDIGIISFTSRITLRMECCLLELSSLRLGIRRLQ